MSVLSNLTRRVANFTADQPPVPLGRRYGTDALSWLTGVGSSAADAERQMEQYHRNGTLYSAVRIDMGAYAGARWHLYRTADGRGKLSGTDTRREVHTHAALSMWNQPNPWMTGRFFRAASRQHRRLTGKSCWVIGYVGSIPGSMWPVRPDRIAPVPDVRKFISGWVYTGPQGEKIPLDNKEVIWIRDPDPLDPYGAVGPVEPLMADLQTSDLTAVWKRNYFLNDATPGGYIEFPVALSDTQFKTLVDRWRDQHQGVNKAHRIAFLEMGAKFSPVATSLSDMQLVEQRQDNRDTVLEALGTSKSLLGVTEDVNRAQAEANEYVYSKYQIRPDLEDLRDVANYQYLPKFGATAQGVEFDFDDPTPEDWQAEAETSKAKAQSVNWLVLAGYDPTESAEAVGLPPIKHTGVIPSVVKQAQVDPESYESSQIEKGAA